jgi:hypothetical protein
VINSAVIILGERNTIYLYLYLHLYLSRSTVIVNHLEQVLHDSMYLPLPAAFEAPKHGMSAFDPAADKGLPSPRCAATALGHHVAERPVARAACHSSEALHYQLSAESFHRTSDSCEGIVYVLPLRYWGFFLHEHVTTAAESNGHDDEYAPYRYVRHALDIPMSYHDHQSVG